MCFKLPVSRRSTTATCAVWTFLGTPGSGKSFSAKREIANAFLVTDDDVIVCDPEAEYTALVQKFEGQVIKISPSSTQYINPMDINANYSEEDTLRSSVKCR